MAESFASTRSSLHDQREFKPRKHISKPGSVHAAKNYDFNQTAFEETDIPPHARAARTIVLDQIDPDHLALKKPRWNGSTYTAEKFPDRAMKRVISAGQSIPPPTNYRAEVVPTAELIPANVNEDRYLKSQKKLAMSRSKELTQPGAMSSTVMRATSTIHPSLEGKTEWNNSTSFGQREMEKRGKRALNESLRQTKKKTQTLLKNYVPPAERERAFAESVRQAKLQQREEEERAMHALY